MLTYLQWLLKTAPYGTLLKVGREIWMKGRGMDGDIMTCANDGQWGFIDNRPRWKPLHILWRRRKVEILYRPSPSARRLLGYGLFCGVLWGDKKKAWQLEGGLHYTREEARNVRTDHCLSREVRPIFTSTEVNVGHHSSPRFVRGDSLPPLPE